MFGKAFPWSRKRRKTVEQDPSPREHQSSDDGVVIRGRKVILREKRIDDAPDDYAWRTDEELSRLDATRPLTLSYNQYLRYAREELEHPSPWSRRLAIDDLQGRHIGNCMYYDIDLRRGEAELGIMIGDRNYWSKGYGTDAVQALLEHIFTTTPLRRIYLHTLEWNHRARRSFAKAGFREVRKVRRGGYDFIRMEITREEWERRRSSRTDEEPPTASQEEGKGSAPKP